MPTPIVELMTRLIELDRRIAQARAMRRAQAIAAVLGLMRMHGLTVADLAAPDARNAPTASNASAGASNAAGSAIRRGATAPGADG